MKAYEEVLANQSGVTCKLIQDEDAQDPRTEFDNFGAVVCWHKRYDLGDEHSFSTPSDFLEWWKANGKGGLLLPLGLLDHSGITMYIGNGPHPSGCDSGGWDSGQVGWIYATREKVREEFGKGRMAKRTTLYKKVEAVLKAEVETYDQYLTGDVWGYVIEDSDGEHLDSCWGFFGSDYAKSEALEQFKYYVEKAEAEASHVEGANTTVEDLTT